MITLESIFDDLKGPAEVAKVIGVKTEHAAALKRRRSIPVRYWPALLAALRAVGVEATEGDFVRIYNERAGDALTPTEDGTSVDRQTS